MCTFFVLRKGGAYAGRNLDLDHGFGEKVVITPRGYPFHLKNGREYRVDFPFIGMASLIGDYPLYAEAVNDQGLAMAGLNFPETAHYRPAAEGKDNITPFELIPWILGQAKSVDRAKSLLSRLNLYDMPFSDKIPLAKLHFMISDRERSIVVEPMKDGLKVYDNPYDVMTNEPPFPFHDYNVRCHMGLSAKEKEGAFLGEGRDIKPFAAGLGAYGLPGDASSPSRFLKAAFEVANDACVHDENECVAEVFNILGSVAMTDGSVANKNGGRDITRYSCCMSLQDASYYYRTYHSGRIIKVPLTKEAASAGRLSVSELLDEPAFYEAEAKTI